MAWPFPLNSMIFFLSKFSRSRPFDRVSDYVSALEACHGNPSVVSSHPEVLRRSEECVARRAVGPLVSRPHLVPLAQPERKRNVPLRSCCASSEGLLLRETEERFDPLAGDILSVPLPNMSPAHRLTHQGDRR